MNGKIPATNLGVNKSERYLGQLCRRSFLSLWSYQGIYRDQDNGKEVCDLLVVFGDHVLIFSDKYCEFPNTGNLQTDWDRWVKRAVLESAKQIRGAERWIRQFPNRIFLDQACTQKLPLNLPSTSNMKVHRILVAHGAAERCKQEFGGSGSLMVDTTIVGEDHVKSFEEGGKPFTVGLIDTKVGFIHVLDDTTLDIVIDNLDTITDFVSYLEKKELLIAQKPLGTTGEEDLLANYLGEVNENGEHDFVGHSGYDLVLNDESWNHFLVSPEKRARDLANEISYSWDRLIERFNYHISTNTQYYTSHPSDININERIVRFMAAEPRTQRRMLARKLVDLVTRTSDTQRGSSIAAPLVEGHPYYVFLVLPLNESVSKEEYREVRTKLLEFCCRVAKVKFPQALDIIGIATEVGLNDLRSEDLLHLDARTWSTEDQLEALELQRELNLFQGEKYYRIHEEEYPAFPRYGRNRKKPSQKVSRNSPCPCGSGKKYKYCCMRKSQL